jgi:hypothetical protein
MNARLDQGKLSTNVAFFNINSLKYVRQGYRNFKKSLRQSKENFCVTDTQFHGDSVGKEKRGFTSEP